jgi:AmmeMemoRadiSam system protein A
MQAWSKVERDASSKLSLAEEHKAVLRGLAVRSIEHGFRFGEPIAVSAHEHPLSLQALKAVFVTLRTGEELRGCVGTLEASHPLVSAVTKYAYAAAFNDRRFDELTEAELPELHVQISILSEPEPLRFYSEKELIERLRPGIDGLILQDGLAKGTLLPSVWEEIPDRYEFLARLKQKAGLSPNHWSASLQVQRYTTVCFS